MHAATLRVERVRHELKRRQLTVLRVETPTPNFRRVVLGGESLADFTSLSFDDHVKLLFDDQTRRDYTPRRFDRDRRELAIDFALHGDGPAAAWAARARAGDVLGVGGPRGSFVVPTGYDWHLLVGDDTALPAIERRLAELPSHVQAIVLLLLAPEDRHALATGAALTLHWADDAAGLLAALRAWTPPPGSGYAWAAGEAALAAAVRRVLVDEKGHDRQAIRAAAYWKQGAADHHENLDG